MSASWSRTIVGVLALVGLSLGLWAIAASWGGHAEAATARYQITADGGQAWMVDTATGRVWHCDDGSCRELPVSSLHPRPGG